MKTIFNKIKDMEGELNQLRRFVDHVRPFLERLQEPRYDENETNDYIFNSSDCKRAVKALAGLDGHRCNDYWREQLEGEGIR